MSRLADYFVVVGYDHSKEGSGVGAGKIIQRFPEKDWDNCPFTQGIELFCQPCGWHLATQKQSPTFFVSVLTDIDAYRHYCACLTFSEDVVTETVSKERADDDDVEEEGVVRCSKLYAPKSLVLVSRLDCFEVFRNCLGIIYANYIDNLNLNSELLVGNILGSIQVPAHGGPAVKFSIGAGDRQCVQSSSCPTLPVTRTSVALLFKQLGISNSLTIFCAALCDHKILFHSMSYSRLTDSSHALTALMYPLKYSYVYIPLIPVGLLEVLSTPTPFIAGVHTSQKPDPSELLDVVVADLDGGSLKIPDNIQISLMPQPMLDRMRNSLQQILRPDLGLADLAFVTSSSKPSQLDLLDKEIRAVFLRFFGELFCSYRSCLNLIRIHPEPVITFHKALFLGHRGLMDDDFTRRVLESMSFNAFVMERGPPYRICDIFDDVFDKMQEILISEQESPEKLLVNIRELAGKLHENENPTQPPFVQKVSTPTEGSHLRVHQPLFPLLDSAKVHEVIQEGLSKQNAKARASPAWQQYPRIVPTGTRLIQSQLDKAQLVSTNARRLEVLKNCISFIFDNKISDARKIFPAVLKVLKSKVARLLLVEELGFHVKSNRSLLEHQQFDLVVRLLNCALQNDSVMDESGVTTAILPLATSFCRKLFTGVIQFAYTCVQDHPVWASQQFWEAAFYQDVQQQICQLYVNHDKLSASFHQSREELESETDHSRETTLRRNDSKRWSSLSLNPPTITAHQKSIAALEIAAEQMRVWPNLTEENKLEMVKNEESTVYSQAIHYANRMVYLRIPLDATKTPRDVAGMEGESLSSMVTNSAADSDSMDGESGFEDPDINEVGAMVAKFILKFIDKVSVESGVSSEHNKSLHQMVPGVIDMHLETLEAIHQEIMRLPPMPKPRILMPVLLSGESIVVDGLRAYLIPDGRDEGTGGTMGGPAFIPAEGAIFMTSYRIIFKGTSCDLLVGEQPIIRSFPISSLTKEKKLNAQYLNHKDLWVQEAIQLRSSTFQMLKAAFDEEVSPEDIETLRKLLGKFRHPPNIHMTFAFTGGHTTARPVNLIGKSKEKNASLKNFAKKTFLKTARKAGIKTKDYSGKRSSKFSSPTPPLNRRFMDYDYGGTMGSESQYAMFTDDLSVIDEQETKVQVLNDMKNFERLAERSYCKDFARLGFGSLHTPSAHPPIRPRPDQFRLTLANINSTYSVCPSYPAVFPVPYSISDDSLQKICRSHRQNRFPVATWRHPTTKALLIRASGFHGKGVMGVFKGHYNNPSGSPQVDGVTTSVTVEQEKYISAIISCTPPVRSTSFLLAPSLTTPPSHCNPHKHPTSSHQRETLSSFASHTKQSFQKVLTNFKTASIREHPSSYYSSSSSSAAMGRSSTKPRYVDRRPVSVMPRHAPESPILSRQNGVTEPNFVPDFHPNFYRSMLYVLGEKTQMKGLRIESLGKCDFVPIEFNDVRNVRTSFKKLLRACVPSSSTAPPSAAMVGGSTDQSGGDGKKGGMLRMVQESRWMDQIENILKVAGLAIDLIDLQGSSVMICLEDGWDFTTQVMSVAQILLDPYYRTIEGFKVLIEKEWLGFGHRFSHRSNQTAANQNSGFAPVFLQFLDVVHQIHSQFPMSFEFNQFYLRFLAFHHLSNRFRTFMLDSELKRVELGWHSQDYDNSGNLTEAPSTEEMQDMPSCSPLPFHTYHNSDLSLSSEAADTLTHQRAHGAKNASLSIWDYIDYHHKRSPVFYNFLYCQRDHETVLRPFSSCSNLKIWDYYLSEDLCTGTPYDLELRDFILKTDEDPDLAPISEFQGIQAGRKVINGCYDNVEVFEPDSCSHLLMEIFKLDSELNGRPPRGWIQQWESLEVPTHVLSSATSSSGHQGSSSWEEQRRRLALQQSNHKKLTVEMLYKSKQLASSSSPGSYGVFDESGKVMFSQPHTFMPHYYTTPAQCNYCSQLLWGLIKSGFHCSDCGYSCHEKCLPHIPKNCTGNKTKTEVSSSQYGSISSSSGTSVQNHSGGGRKEGTGDSFRKFTEHHTCTRGVPVQEGSHAQGLEESMVCLDSVKHQLKTTRRTYHFYATEQNSVQELIDKIQLCI